MCAALWLVGHPTGKARAQNTPCPLGTLTASASGVCEGDTVWLTAVSIPPCTPPNGAGWGNALTSNDSTWASVAADSAGNTFLAGVFSGTIAWPGGSWTAQGNSDAFLAKFTSCGQPAWVISASSSGGGELSGSSGSALATAPDGSVFWAGRHIGSLTIRGTAASTFTASGIPSANPAHTDGFLVKIAPSGTVTWGTTLTGSSGEALDGLAVTSDGGVVVFGEFNACCESSGSAELRGPGWTHVLTQPTTSHLRTGVLARLGPAGTFMWANTVSNREAQFRSVAVGNGGTVFAALVYRSWNVFANTAGPPSVYRDANGLSTSISNPGYAGAALVAIGSTGNLMWARNAGNAGSLLDGILTHATAVVVDAAGRPVLAGHYRSLPFTLPGTAISLPAVAGNRGFLARWDVNGTPLEAYAIAPNGSDDYLWDAAALPDGSFSVVGATFTSVAGLDAYRGTLSTLAATPTWTLGGSSGSDAWTSVAAFGSGTVVGGRAGAGFATDLWSVSQAGMHYGYSAPQLAVPVEVTWTTGSALLQGSGSQRFALSTVQSTFGATFTAGTASCSTAVSVQVFPVDTVSIEVMVPEGAPYVFAGSTYYAPDSVVIPFTSAWGCDSLVILNLTLEPPCFGQIPGCLDPTACNFAPEANCDDGSCIPSGCMDSAACNFLPTAGCPGDACLFIAFETPSPVCAGDSVQLAVTAEVEGAAGWVPELVWATGQTHTPRTVTPTASTAYAFTVTAGPIACAAAIPVTVIPHVINALTVELLPGETYTLAGETSSAPGLLTAVFVSSAGCDSAVVVQLVLADPCDEPGAVPGCMDPQSCSYDPTATCDDGSCSDTCCPGPGCCAPGTEWMPALGMCVVAGDVCGPGTFWNSALGLCMPVASCLGDYNGDLEVDTADLMDFLLLFGTTCGNFPGGWGAGVDPGSLEE